MYSDSTRSRVKQTASDCAAGARALEETCLRTLRTGLTCPHMQAECRLFPDIVWNTGYDGSGGPDWQAASHAFRQTWGEVEETDLSTTEAFKQVRACLPATMCFHLQSIPGMPADAGL